MEIREAILKAVDWIQGNPSKFRYENTCQPTDCGSPGCAIGWIGYFSGFTYELPKYARGLVLVERDISTQLLKMSSVTFYLRLNALGQGWMDDAAICARVLRLYADKYHPVQPLPSTGPSSRRRLICRGRWWREKCRSAPFRRS